MVLKPCKWDKLPTSTGETAGFQPSTVWPYHSLCFPFYGIKDHQTQLGRGTARLHYVRRDLRSQGWCIFHVNEELKNPRILKITGQLWLKRSGTPRKLRQKSLLFISFYCFFVETGQLFVRTLKDFGDKNMGMGDKDMGMRYSWLMNTSYSFEACGFPPQKISRQSTFN